MFRRVAISIGIAMMLAVAAFAWTQRDATADPAWVEAARSIVDPERGKPYLRETFFVRSGADLIAATFLRPDDDTRVPAMLVVSGSGNGILTAESMLHRQLVARGYGVLVLGKKGVRASSGDWRDETFADRAANVRAALDWLGGRSDVEVARTVLYGHSQGGYVIPLLAGDPRVAGLILAAGSAQPVRDQIADDIYETTLRRGTSEVEARAAAEAQVRWLDRLRPVCGLFAVHYLCHIYDHDPADSLRAIRKPVLVLFGGNDPLVPVSTNQQRMGELLAANPAAEIEVIPEANHLFWASRTGLPEEYDSLIGPEVVFAHQRHDDADYLRLSRLAANRVRYGDGYLASIDRFLARHVPARGMHEGIDARLD